MRLLDVVLFLAVFTVIIFIGTQPDSSGAAKKDPNPMKANAEQFSRMQQTDACFAEK